MRIKLLNVFCLILLLCGCFSQETYRQEREISVFFGDSITEGLGASTQSQRWSTLVAKRQNLFENNQGISGTVLQNSSPLLPNNGRNRYQSDIISHSPRYVYILYGLNDLRYDNELFSVLNFQNDLGEVVAGIIASGVRPKNIVIGSPPYINPSGYSHYFPYNAGSIEKHKQYRDATRVIANKYKTKWVDIYQKMIDKGGNVLVSGDLIHPNNEGHQVISNAMLNAK